MDKVVTRNEMLYRVVKRSQPDSMNADGQPTSALFKQEDGVSVDRDGERDEEEIVNTFRTRFTKRFKGLVRVSAGVCIDNCMAVIPEDENNKYHVEIFENFEKTPLSSLNALILADCARVVIYAPSVQWSVQKTVLDSQTT